MVDVLLSNENLAVFGGPAQIDVSLDYGAQGQRGTFIFTDNGKPTDLDIQFSQTIQPYDLYINLKASDPEYLFLYQYGSINGVLAWSKVLRLIPNTALANIPIVFYQGDAVTFIADPGVTLEPSEINFALIVPSFTEPLSPTSGMLWLDISTDPLELKSYAGASWVKIGSLSKGILFPIGDFFALEDLGTISTQTFNIQYAIISPTAVSSETTPGSENLQTPVASGLTLGELSQFGDKVFLPVYIRASEMEQDLTAWGPITGIKMLSFVVTANIGTLEV